MKILMRRWNGQDYVWKTAKYNKNKFWIDGCEVTTTKVVSVINDNRKKYVQCSSCGQVFRKGDARFERHKEMSASPETCFNCPNMVVDTAYRVGTKYRIDENGEFIETSERSVCLKCSKGSLWNYKDITSDEAISHCAQRQCKTAGEVEIKDIFTRLPGVFDDIITIDRLLDAGYDVYFETRMETCHQIKHEDYLDLYVYINEIGIVDRFVVYIHGNEHMLYYSRKYDELFTIRNGDYELFTPEHYWYSDVCYKVKEEIAKLYR